MLTYLSINSTHRSMAYGQGQDKKPIKKNWKLYIRLTCV